MADNNLIDPLNPLDASTAADLGDDVDAAAVNSIRYDEYREIGASGLPHYAGLVFEEFLSELRGERWKKIVRQMTDNDSVIGSLLFGIEMMVRQADWDVKPFDDSAASEEDAKFVEECLFDDMENTWDDTLSEILTMLAWGWSFLEMVFKQRQGPNPDPAKHSRFDDGKIGFGRWALRAQESLWRWRFDATGRAVVLEQMPAPDYQLRVIPLSKGLLFRTTARKSNPEGHSVLRSAYTSWYYKSNIERIEAIGIERDLAGIPVGRIPLDILTAEGSDPKAAVFTKWKQMITRIKRDEDEGVIIPSDCDERGNKLFDLELLTSGGTRTFDTNQIIQRYDQRIALCVLADFILLGHTQKSGSYGMSESKIDLFATALSAWLDSICATINRTAIPKLYEMNGMDAERQAQLTHGEVKPADLAAMGDYVTKLVGAGAFFTPEEIAYLKEQAKIPVPKDAADGPATAAGMPNPAALAQILQKALAGNQQQGQQGQQGQQQADGPPNSSRQPFDKSKPKQAAEPATPSATEIREAEAWLRKMLPTEAAGLADYFTE